MRPGSDAHGPRGPDLIVDGFEFQVVVEYLNPAVAPISDINVALGIGRYGVREVELALARPSRPDGRDESPVFVVLDDSGVAISIRDKDASGGVPSHVG